ncbi:protein of unknown function [Paraburkholderia dioscoreae]|uniref:Uncharacterized protein n=1 Tax=Paraburkholderia dioscoreae TaxID=2604047 RepID=A0A5Q4YW99_9BURK|nr:protein of unknown function [Paraburkholderia dioscoreae]
MPPFQYEARGRKKAGGKHTAFVGAAGEANAFCEVAAGPTEKRLSKKNGANDRYTLPAIRDRIR